MVETPNLAGYSKLMSGHAQDGLAPRRMIRARYSPNSCGELQNFYLTPQQELLTLSIHFYTYNIHTVQSKSNCLHNWSAFQSG